MHERNHLQEFLDNYYTRPHERASRADNPIVWVGGFQRGDAKKVDRGWLWIDGTKVRGGWGKLEPGEELAPAYSYGPEVELPFTEFLPNETGEKKKHSSKVELGKEDCLGLDKYDYNGDERIEWKAMDCNNLIHGVCEAGRLYL